MSSDFLGQRGSLGLAVGAFAASELYGMARLALYGEHRGRSRDVDPNPPLLERSHKLIKREKVMFQVGRVQNAVGGKDVVHTFIKRNSKDRECKDAFRFYRPVRVSQWAFNTYGAEFGSNTAAVSLTNQVSGTLTTTKVNAALNASFGFLPSASMWAAGPSNKVLGLYDPGVQNVSIVRSMLSNATGATTASQAVANTLTTVGDSNFRYLLGPTAHHLLVENMAPYATDLEVYVIQSKYDSAILPIQKCNDGANDNDFEGSTTFFPKESIEQWDTKPTHFRTFNEQFRVCSKKKYRLAAGCNIELIVRTKGWKKITNVMLANEAPLMPSTSFYIWIRAKGPSGWVKPLGEIDGGICDIPVKLGYRIKESYSVLPCPYNIEKRSRIKTDLTDYVSLNNVQFFNTATGNPTSLTAAVAQASAMMGVNNV